MSALSPASSPRLPSPPPMAEDQLGPLSPSVGISEEQGKSGLVGSVDHGASRRIRPGTKSADMAEGPPLMELKDIDSAFQLTEHLKALHNSLTHPEDKDHSVPVDKETALRLAQPPDGVDRNIWLYELCRFLSQKANSIIIALFADNPPCSAQTCPEMRASEWQYLCAVHDPPKSCCAIDYCCHTLDWAANTLTSPKSFPSRLALGTEMNNQHTQVRQLTNIFRRVYRIFAHAWFQHRDVFWKVEGRTGLYIFFKTVCDVYNLIDKDNYTIPQEAEGLANEGSEQRSLSSTKEESERQETVTELPRVSATPVGNTTTVTGNTTKRHRQTPSLSQAPVTTVVEELEEEEDGGQRKQAGAKSVTISSETPKETPEAVDETPETKEEGKEAENEEAVESKDDPPRESVENTDEETPATVAEPDTTAGESEADEETLQEKDAPEEKDSSEENDEEVKTSEQSAPETADGPSEAAEKEKTAKDEKESTKTEAD